MDRLKIILNNIGQFFILIKNKLRLLLYIIIEAIQTLYASPQYQHLVDRLTQYALLVRLHRPIGIFLLMWPALWAIWIASTGQPDWYVVTIILLGCLTMRSAGCAINDFADRKIDAHVNRTQDRPIARGTVSPREAILVFIILGLTAFGLVLLLNALTIYLSFAGIVLAAAYPFSKRYTYLPQVFLGITFGWAVPMAYAAQAGELTKVTWLIYIAAILWIVAYDTIYAMVDRDDDLRIGVKSTAILFGSSDVMIIMLLQGMVLITLYLLGTQLKFGVFYYTGLTVAILSAVYQFFLIKNRNPQKCLKAFLNNNYFGMAVFVGIVLEYWLKSN